MNADVEKAVAYFGGHEPDCGCKVCKHLGVLVKALRDQEAEIAKLKSDVAARGLAVFLIAKQYGPCKISYQDMEDIDLSKAFIDNYDDKENYQWVISARIAK